MQPNSSIPKDKQELSLPPSVATKRDVVRLQLQLEQYLEALVRVSASASSRQLPVVPPDIVHMCAHNDIQQLDVHQIERLKQGIANILAQSPLVHIALSTEPDEKTIERFIEWFRREIHPLCLLQISVQPSIAGGCVVRTSNRIYDFSFRHMLLVSQKKLTEAIAR